MGDAYKEGGEKASREAKEARGRHIENRGQARGGVEEEEASLQASGEDRCVFG